MTPDQFQRIETLFHEAKGMTAEKRMDFLLVTPDLYPRVRAEGIDHAWRVLEKPSDHAPVWMDLD